MSTFIFRLSDLSERIIKDRQGVVRFLAAADGTTGKKADAN